MVSYDISQECRIISSFFGLQWDRYLLFSLTGLSFSCDSCLNLIQWCGIVAKKLISDPLLLFLLAASAILFIWGAGWGLPNSESWLSDSLAPWHPLIGLSKGFSFGYYNKYPFGHLALLSLLNLPVVIVALVQSNPFEGMEIFRFLSLIRTPEYATWLIIIDRSVSIVMGTLSVYLTFLITRRLFSREAGLLAALLLPLNPVFNFYSHVAKVEVPYIFWALVAIWFLIKALDTDERKYYIYTALSVVMSFGAKDQGYAFFVVPLLFYVGIRPLMVMKDRPVIRRLFNSNTLIFLLVFITATVVVQNLFFNWEGFIERVEALTGWNYKRSVSYTSTLQGYFMLIVDSFRSLLRDHLTLLPFMALITGFILAVFKSLRDKKSWHEMALMLLPFIASLSYFLFFHAIVKQSSNRFVLPYAVLMLPFAGYLLNELLQRLPHRALRALLMFLIIAWPLYESVSINLSMANDLRYEVEEWLEDRMKQGKVIEYYSYLHYLPRFPDGVESYRVRETIGDIEDRKPDYIVLTSHYYERFRFKGEVHNADGRVTVTPKQQQFLATGFPDFFDRLFADETEYYLLKRFDRKERWYREAEIAHISPRHIMIYARRDSQ